MAVSKVVYGGSTLIDLTADTVTASTLAAGATAHGSDGEPVTGTLSVREYRVSSAEPAATDGQDGDLWLVV